MPKPTGPTHRGLQQLIIDLRKLSVKEKTPLWKRLSHDLSVATRKRCEVNLQKLEQVGNSDEIMVVPGKVLGHGLLTKKLTVAAFRFSDSAKTLIQKNGKTISIRELMQSNPKGKKVRILG